MADIPDNTSTTASIGVAGTVSGILDFAGDHDWFAVTLIAGQTVTITLTGGGAGGVSDTYLNVWNSRAQPF